MLTTFGLQVAFYSLCAVIITLALSNIIRRKRRERLLAQRPHEELNRLDRLQQELQEAERRQAEQARDVAATTDALPVSILKPEAAALATAVNATAVPSTVTTTAERSLNAEGVPAYRPSGTAETTWQDRTLFGSQTQSGWRGSPAIPRVEPHEVPTVDTSDYVFGPDTGLGVVPAGK